VVAADRGREFAWVVGGGNTRWGYTLEPVDGGTRLTESWEFLPAGQAFFREKYGEDAPRQVEDRVRLAHTGIPATLAAVKRIAEARTGHAEETNAQQTNAQETNAVSPATSRSTSESSL
jgi:hypothetical protein